MNIEVKVTYKNGKLQEMRLKRGLSQSQLAEMAGIKFRVYQNYEQGVRDISKAQLSTILSICLALDCLVEDIVTDPETLDLLNRYTGRSAK